MVALNLLRARSLSRSFGGLRAVHNVDFDLEQGEIRAIIGPNGAGKTTFVSLLSGRLEATDGSIEFCGQDITDMPIHARVRRGIAYTFQITSIYPNLTVFENIAIAAQNRLGINDDNGEAGIRATVDTVLKRTDLQRLSREQAGTLAYGHQRLVEVAMGLAINPLLLILDEPTQGLSDSEIQSFCQLVREINEFTTVLLIEHNMSVVMSLAQRITVFDHGEVLAEGGPGEIQDSAEVQAAYLGT